MVVVVVVVVVVLLPPPRTAAATLTSVFNRDSSLRKSATHDAFCSLYLLCGVRVCIRWLPLMTLSVRVRLCALVCVCA